MFNSYGWSRNSQRRFNVHVGRPFYRRANYGVTLVEINNKHANVTVSLLTLVADELFSSQSFSHIFSLVVLTHRYCSQC